MSRKSLVLAIGLALSAYSVAPVYSAQQPLVDVCSAPPALVNPERQYTPKPGVGVTTWKFNSRVTHDGGEDTRISVASSSLNLFDWEVGSSKIPSFLNPHQSVIEKDAAVAINADFFNLYGDPLPWGPAMNDEKLLYFPLASSPQTGYTVDWIKIVGVVSRIPDAADGWSTTGSVTINGKTQFIAGLNLPSLPLDGVVIYDNRRTKATPIGDVSILVSGNEIIDFDLTGKSYTPQSGQSAIQATGKAATNLRTKFVGREVQVDLGKTESRGFKTKGTANVGNVSVPLAAVNLGGSKTSIFTSGWSGATPKQSLTWLVSGGKIRKIYAKGSSALVGPKQIVVQITNPTQSMKAITVGSTIKLNYKKPTIAQGFNTNGSVEFGSSDFNITAINRPLNANGISLFTSQWQGKTPAGAVTMRLKGGKITALYNAGKNLTANKDEYILQVPQILAPDVRAAFISPVSNVVVDETVERIETIAETKARYKSTVTANGEKLFLGTLNYYQANPWGGEAFPPDPNYGSVFDDNWQGTYGDGVTLAGSASIRIRAGLIQKINKGGSALRVELPGDVVIQLGVNQAQLVQDWSVGMAATFVSKYQTKNGEPYKTFIGYGTRLITDNKIDANCSNAGSQVRPRTAIGWNDAGQYWLMTASPASRDQSNSGYRLGGANYPQVARWLKSLGATHAVGVDGGGSTWMVRRTSTGAERVDLPEPNNDGNPWIRWVPFELMLISANQ